VQPPYREFVLWVEVQEQELEEKMMQIGECSGPPDILALHQLEQMIQKLVNRHRSISLLI
jgi:hypothetical protein